MASNATATGIANLALKQVYKGAKNLQNAVNSTYTASGSSNKKNNSNKAVSPTAGISSSSMVSNYDRDNAAAKKYNSKLDTAYSNVNSALTSGDDKYNYNYYLNRYNSLNNAGLDGTDYQNSSSYKNMIDAYNAQGKAAAEQGLASAAANTGGVASSYANAVANQARQAYANQGVTNAIQQAYTQYQDKLANYLNSANANYNAWQDRIGNYVQQYQNALNAANNYDNAAQNWASLYIQGLQ